MEEQEINLKALREDLEGRFDKILSDKLSKGRSRSPDTLEKKSTVNIGGTEVEIEPMFNSA